MWADQPVREWIDAVCRQYSRVMGRALTFDPQAAAGPAGTRLGTDAGEHWRTTISDGTRTVGVLRLRSRSGHERDADFLRACETAELTAQLIERVLITRGDDYPGPGNPRRSRRTSAGSVPPSVARLSTGSLDPSFVTHRIDRLLDAVRRMTGFPAAALFVRDAESGVQRLSALRSTAAVDIQPQALAACPAALADDCCADRVTVFRGNAEPLLPMPFLPPGISTSVVHCVGDLKGADGALWLFDRRDRRLTHRDRHVLGLASARLEPLIQYVALLDESSSNRVLKAELRVASRTHPSAPIHYRGRDGWCEFAGCAQSARGIGGDLFELIPLAEERVFLAVGDATGHSIPAAMVMANVRGAIRALLDGDPPDDGRTEGLAPQEVLRRLNKVLHGIVQSHQFMTMFCGILDGPQMRFEYANAGHPQPLLLRDGRVERLETHGLVLGVTDDAAYDRAAVSLQGGDVLLFYTDGVTEAACRERSLFGSQRVEDAMRHCADRTAVEIRDELWSALQGHLSGSDQKDDRTFTVLRILKNHEHRESPGCRSK